jgi:hypothetical protein
VIKLIAFYSNAMGSGKTTSARHLVMAKGFTLMRFAGPLKAMTSALLREVGYTHTETRLFIDGDIALKEQPLDRLQNFTTRRIMQTLGTEWARDNLHEDFWVNVMREAISPMVSAGKPVVIDDLRYRNEAHMLKALGAMIVRIDRDEATVSAPHSSEGELAGYSPDFILENNGPLDALQADLDLLVSAMG